MARIHRVTRGQRGADDQTGEGAECKTIEGSEGGLVREIQNKESVMYETGNSVARRDNYEGGDRPSNYDMSAKTATAKLGLEAHAAELRGAIEETSKRLHALESRLTPILVNLPPMVNSNTSGPDGPTPNRSPLMNASFDAKYAVNGLMRHIESLLNRIEL